VKIRSFRRITAIGLTSIATMAAVALATPGSAQAHTSGVAAPSVASTVTTNPILFYRAGDGLAVTGAVDSSGGFTSLQGVGGFTTGWTSITPTSGGRLLFYRASDGLAVTGFVDSSGGFTNLQTVGGFGIGWTRITATDDGPLLFYRASDGVAVTGIVDSNGGFTSLQQVGGFTQNWSQIAASSG
jgi:hypothetical protein